MISINRKNPTAGEITSSLTGSNDAPGLHFDGVSSRVEFTPADLGTKFSFEFIVQADAWSAQQFLVDFGTVGRFVLAGLTANSMNLSIFDGTSWKSLGVKVLDDLKVHHLTLTVDGTAAVLYDNANQVGTATISAAHAIDSTTVARLGCEYNANSNEFVGTFYRARFWNKTLTAAEVTASYENATVPFADQYGSQTDLIVNGAFAADTNWTKQTGWTIGSGVAHCATTDDYALYQAADNQTIGKKYRITFTISNYVSGGVTVDDDYGAGKTLYAANGTFTEEFTSATVTTSIFGQNSVTSNLDIDNVSVVEIGAVADYDLAFANPTQSDQVQDRSTNLVDGTASATGVVQVTPIEQVNTNKLAVGGTTPLVGIGLAAGVTPSNPLHVYHATINGVAMFESGDADGGIGLKDSATTEPSYLLAEGNTLKFQTNTAVRMTINADGALTLDGDTANGWMQFKDAGVLSGYIGGGIGLAASPNNLNTDLAIRAKTKLAFCTNNASAAKMTIDTAGNVGLAVTPVATTHPSLQVGGNLTTVDSPNIIINDHPSFRGEIGYSQSGLTEMYLANIYNNDAARMDFRMKGNTSAHDVLSLTGDGLTTVKAIVETGGVLKSNLLTNSAFSVWSNSTLEDVATIAEDDCASDDTGDWGSQIRASLAFDTDHYNYSTTGAYNEVMMDGLSVTAGKLYKIQVQVKDGTGSSTTLQLKLYDGAAHYGPAFLTTGSFDPIHTFVVEATSTTASATFGLFDATAFANNIEFKNFIVTEVTPGCVAADEKAMDGWSKASDGYGAFGPDILRQHDDSGTLTHDGAFYSTKMTTGTAGHTALTWPSYDIYREPTLVARFQGRTVTFGMWVKMADSASNFVLNISDGVGSSASTAHAANTDWEWMEATHTFSGSSTEVKIHCYSNTAGSVHYISQPMAVFGSAIGAGNYSRPSGEWIDCEANIPIQAGVALAAADDKTLNLEALSEGKIPKGCRAIKQNSAINNTSITSDEGVGWGPSAAWYYQHRNYPAVSNVFNIEEGTVLCDANGDIYQKITEAGDTINAAYQNAFAIQLR